MDRTPCFNTLAADRHLRLVEASSLEDLHAELTNDMQRALAGLQSHVPGFDGFGPMPVERLKSPADEVISALDRMKCLEVLMLGLKDGEGPHWAAMRREIVDGYVANNADSIAEARGAYQ